VSASPDLGAVVVGTSIGVLLHVPALRDAGFSVRGLVGRDAERTAHRAAILSVPAASTSLTEALELPGVDVVVVATPPLSHGPLVREALAAGKHVVCEKPFARDTAEARELLAAAESAGVVHALNTQFRYDSPQALLNRVVRGGLIGEPRLAVELLQVPTLADPSATVPAWFDQVDEGGGWFAGSAPHIFDRIRSILGEFVSVAGSVQRLGARAGVTADDTYTLTFTLDSGVEGVVHSSAAVAAPPLFGTQYTGTQGSAWIDAAAHAVMVDDGNGARRIEMPDDLVSPPPVPPPAELIQSTYDQWHATGNEVIPCARLHRAVRARILGEPDAPDPVLPTFVDGIALHVLMDAIAQSSAEHRTVAVAPV
jgi:predicted dehydrogenase